MKPSPVLLKMAASTCLLCLALTFALTVRKPTVWFALAAMALSWLGDASLSKWTPFARLFQRNVGSFLGGMACFAAAQFLYLMAFEWLHNAVGVPFARIARFVLPMMALEAALWLLLRERFSPAAIRGGLLVYGMLLFAMAGFALSAANAVPVAHPYGSAALAAFAPLAGALLFLLSDGLIAYGLARGSHAPWLSALVWATYVPAQALLLTGIAARSI